MPNPIPENVRLWLYLAGTGVLVVASGGVLPPEHLRLATTGAAVLTMLAAANVTPRPPETAPVQAEDDYESQQTDKGDVEDGDAEGEGV